MTEKCNFNPQTRRDMAVAIEATVHETPARHFPLLSKPEAAVKIIAEGANT